MTRKDVYDQINRERRYQNTTFPTKEALASELVLMKTYIENALYDYTYREDSRHQVRKIVALGVRCLENHGCPERD